MEDPDHVLELLGRRIAELRASSGLTQAEVSRRLDTAVNNYQRIEHGLQNVTVRTLAKIASVLSVPVAALFEMPTSVRRSRGRPRS